MGLRLIEVTDRVTNGKMTINMDNVEAVIDGHEKTIFIFGTGNYTVKETYEEIKYMLNQMVMRGE